MKKKQHVPIKKGVAKTPLVMQMEATECGAACLTMILSYYGLWASLEQIRFDCGVSRDGANALNVIKTARRYGMEADGYRYKLETLKEKAEFPCIVFSGFNHFVVLNGFRNGKAYLNDPARGNYAPPIEEFEKDYSGVYLELHPGENFVPQGKPKSILQFTAEKLKGTGKEMVLFSLITASLSLIGLLTPAISRFFIDYILTGGFSLWGRLFFGSLAFIGFMQVLMEIIQSIYTLKINGKLDLQECSAYIWHILRLPVQFFDRRVVGDIAQRKNENADVSKVLIQTLAPLCIKACLIIVYLIVLIRYNPVLSCIGILSIVIKVAVARFISYKRINIARVQKRDYGNLVASTMNGISIIESIKSAAAEEGYFAKWAGYQAGSNAQKQKYTLQDAFLGLIPTAVGHICDLIILGGGIYLVINGSWTLGMITSFQGILALFLTPANDFVNATQTLQELRSSMERIDDVMKAKEIVWEEDDLEEDAQKLSGQISIDHISFGYSTLAAPLISDFSLDISPGESIAVVGASGSGKSTLTRLLTGLYEPWEGSITFDGKRIEEINRYVFTGSISCVDQDIHLMEDTIANNIRFGNTAIEDFEIILAAKDACIHNEIIERDLGYEDMLTDGGRDLSGGQRQRIEIARALAMEPSIMVMDEATSALDAATEFKVIEAIKRRGITTIMIAHRLSAIRDCDRILVLDHGKLVEQGTHNELVALKGYYYRLISTD